MKRNQELLDKIHVWLTARGYEKTTDQEIGPPNTTIRWFIYRKGSARERSIIQVWIDGSVHSPDTDRKPLRELEATIAEWNSPFQVGDEVKYKAAFLRSTGMYTHDVANAAGTVVGLLGLGHGVPLIAVKWPYREEEYIHVLASNLVLKSRTHLEPA